MQDRHDSESQHRLNVTPQIKERGRTGYFTVTIKPIGGNEVMFESATAPREAYDRPPQKLGKIQDIKNLLRDESKVSSYVTTRALVRPWSLQLEGLPPILGTADHHELLYSLMQGDRNKTNPDDVLLNFDSHEDVSQQNSLEQEGNRVDLANFVGQGVRKEFRKVWNHYILVAPDKASSESMAKNLPGQSERFSDTQIAVALDKALKVAQEKQSQIILTIDLDFFGAFITTRQGNSNLLFDAEKSQKDLALIVNFIKEHANSIRLVHITESLAYAIEGNNQVKILYDQLISLLS